MALMQRSRSNRLGNPSDCWPWWGREPLIEHNMSDTCGAKRPQLPKVL